MLIYSAQHCKVTNITATPAGEPYRHLAESLIWPLVSYLRYKQAAKTHNAVDSPLGRIAAPLPAHEILCKLFSK